eukprot:TRINITY_DN27846_c0_g1_i3.p1 TRINITY_DN27846_c0_g1~~TRINITY_DN27846_c0_g1_i3.p1  ORF type:complete len:544 (-),score=91.82 TRINITY_DN27846_c0_g1_i3:629-2203(-)
METEEDGGYLGLISLAQSLVAEEEEDECEKGGFIACDVTWPITNHRNWSTDVKRQMVQRHNKIYGTSATAFIDNCLGECSEGIDLTFSARTPAAAEGSDESDSSNSDNDNCKRQLGEVCSKLFPLLGLLPSLTATSVWKDILAGLTAGVMGVPEGLSYAKIAGLHPAMGLYASIVPVMVYAVLGSSRQLIMGPVAMASLLLESGLEGSLSVDQCPESYDMIGNLMPNVRQAELCPAAYKDMALHVSLLCGIIMILASLMQLGFLVKFLGHPMVSGFSSGAAITVIVNQLKHLLGVEVERSEFPLVVLRRLVCHAQEAKPLVVLLSLSLIWGLVTMRVVGKRHPRFSFLAAMTPLLCCAGGVLLVQNVASLQHMPGLSYVGRVDGGKLQWAKTSAWTLHNGMSQLPTATSIALVSFMETFAGSKNTAREHKYTLSSSRELFALGMANLVGSFCSAYLTTGSLSRSAVSNSTGATSQIAALTSGAVALSTLLFLMPLMHYLPDFVLSAIVVSAVARLIEQHITSGS